VGALVLRTVQYTTTKQRLPRNRWPIRHTECPGGRDKGGRTITPAVECRGLVPVITADNAHYLLASTHRQAESFRVVLQVGHHFIAVGIAALAPGERQAGQG